MAHLIDTLHKFMIIPKETRLPIGQSGLPLFFLFYLVKAMAVKSYTRTIKLDQKEP